MSKVYWLNVCYEIGVVEMGKVDAAIRDVLKIQDGAYDSGVGFGGRDLNFPFRSEREAQEAKRKLKTASLPFALDIWITEQGDDD